MRILWHSTAPWSPSSYSIITKRVVPSILANGHTTVISTWYGLEGMPLPWSVTKNEKTYQVTILPRIHGAEQYQGDVLQFHYKQNKCDLLVTCSDAWVFNPKQTYMTNFAPWLPVDTEPAPQALISTLKPAIYPMVYSKWGVEVLAGQGVEAHYVPCSAPVKTFTPGDKQAARDVFHVDREFDFLATMVAANKDGADRKGFSEALQGFAKFLEKRPGAMLYVHTNWGGPINIANIATRLGIQDHVIQPDQYAYATGMFSEEYMAQVYRASDVLLNPCKSEGFGLPIVEAQMCGTPVIAADFATTDELLFAGWKLDGQRDWYAGADAWRWRVFVDGVADALDEAYKEKDNRKLHKKATNGAKRYDNELVFKQYWKPALKEIEALVNRGKRVHQMAEGIGVVPIQGRNGPADHIIPESDQLSDAAERIAQDLRLRGRFQRQYPGRVASLGNGR